MRWLKSNRIAAVLFLLATLLAAGVAVSAHAKNKPGDAVGEQTVGQFVATGSMTTPRENHAAALLRDGTVLIAGGDSHPGSMCCTAVPTSGAELYDPSTGTFSPVGEMTSARTNVASVILPDGQVCVTD